MRKPGLIIGVAAGVLATVLLAIAVWMAVVYTGTYNVRRRTGMLI